MDVIKGSDLVGLGAAMEQLRLLCEAACGKRLQPGDRVEVLGYERWIPGELVKVVPSTAGYVTTYEVRTDDGETWLAIAEAIRAEEPQRCP